MRPSSDGGTVGGLRPHDGDGPDRVRGAGAGAQARGGRAACGRPRRRPDPGEGHLREHAGLDRRRRRALRPAAEVRAAPAVNGGAGNGCRRCRAGGRERGDRSATGRRGVRLAVGERPRAASTRHLRRAHGRAGEPGHREAGPALLPGGGRSGHVGAHGAALHARCRAGPTGRQGAGQRRLGWSGDVRGADRQGARGGGHRGVQHAERRSGAVARRRPRHRLYGAGLHPRRAALRRDPRQRVEPPPVRDGPCSGAVGHVHPEQRREHRRPTRRPPPGWRGRGRCVDRPT